MNIVAVQIVHYLKDRTAESGLDVVRKLLKTYMHMLGTDAMHGLDKLVQTGKNMVKEDRGNVDVGRIRKKTSKLKVCLPALARCGNLCE